MSRTRIALMLVVAGGLGLAATPQAQAAKKSPKIHATAVAVDPISQYVASLLANEQALIAAEGKYIARQNADIAKLLSGRGNAAALKADIASLQTRINLFTSAIQQTSAYTPLVVNALLPSVTNPTLKQQFALLNLQQQVTTNYFVARPSATPFAV